MGLVVLPLTTAIAFNFSLTLTLTGTEYRVDEVVGVEPSVV